MPKPEKRATLFAPITLAESSSAKQQSTSLVRFGRSEPPASTKEYAVILGLVGAIAISGLVLAGGRTNNAFQLPVTKVVRS